MGTEVSCPFCVSDEVMNSLVTSYYGRQSIEKLTAQPYVMIIDWLLIALSHTVQSVENVLMSSLFYFFSKFPWNTFDIRTVEAYQIMHCVQYSRPLQCLC